MSVTVNVYYFLPHLTEDREEIEVDGVTIGQCMEQLVNRYPAVKKWLFGEDGKISNFVDIYVNLEIVDPDDLSMPVNDGDVIHIVMMLTGG
jgi:molybdopterin converting factor small subunit